MDFVHLHLHSDNSLLDGSCNIEKLVKRAKAIGMRSLALTEHGNMFGAIEFYEACMNHNIKPIIGMEAYVAPESRKDRTKTSSEEPAYHLTLLVRNEIGYRNLCRLSTLSYKEGFYYKPRMDKEILKKYSDGLMMLSGCPKSEFGKACMEKEEGRAKKIIKDWVEIFGQENVFIEVQDHQLEIEKYIQHYGEKIAKDMGIDLVATNDVHYIEKADYKAHDVLLAINTGKTVYDKDRMKYETPTFYLKSAKEMYETFPAKFHGALENTLKVAEKSNLLLTFDEIHMPIYNTEGRSSAEMLTEMCCRNLAAKYPENYDLAKQRLDYELSVINKMAFSSYFLIVQDIVNHAKKSGIQVGPGRGSAAGSIISYLLGITELDPLKYNLLFERFLNPERRELPDIDIDLEPAGRAKIINYLKMRYGEDNVAQIITFSIMKSRLVLRDVSRALSIDLKVADALAKRIPRSQIIDVTISSVLQQDAELKSMVEKDEKLKELIDVSLKLEGLKRHVSKHAAGIVISDKPIMEYCPLYYKDNEEITQYDMDSVQKLGLLKIDILGVETLSIIEDTVRLINKKRKMDLSLKDIPLDDKKTFELLCKGLVKGVFQLEATKAARDLLFSMKPSRIEDVMTAVALNRPGPMQSGMVDLYIRGKSGQLPEHKIPQLKPILEDTYGAMIYQEQIMIIANKVAGFTLAEADKLRKAMGKKIPELMQEYSEKFVKGCVKHGVNETNAKELYAEIEKFAGYGFNKSHAAAYGLISYYTAYLKANYPLEFLSVLMTHNLNDHDKMYEYLVEAKTMEIEVLPPCINKSEYGIHIEGDKLRLGLGCVRNAGEAAVREIINKRRMKPEGRYKDFIDFSESIDIHTVDKRAVEYVVKTGAFDSVENNRSYLINNYEQIIKLASKKMERLETGQLQLFSDIKDMDYPNIDKTSQLSSDVLLAYEKESLGFYLRDNPLDKYRELISVSNFIPIGELHNESGKDVVVVCGLINQLQMKVIHSGPKKGSHYAILRISDFSGNCEAVCFQSALEKCSKELREDNVVVIEGRIDQRGENPSIITNYAENIETYLKRKYSVNIRVNNEEKDKIEMLKKLLSPGPNYLPVRLELVDNERVVKINLGDSFALKPTNDEVAKVREVFPVVKLVKNGR